MRSPTNISEPAPLSLIWADSHPGIQHRVHVTGRLPLFLVILTLALIVLEGAARKWFFGATWNVTSYIAYLSKDFAFGALLLLGARYPKASFLRPYRKALVVGGICIMAGVIISSVQGGVNPAGAALTLRAMLVLPMLAYCLVTRIPASAAKVTIWVAVLFTVANCLLGILQNRLPSDHILNQYAVSGMRVVAELSGVRATGTFAYITGLTIMSIVGVWAGLALLSLATSLREKAAGWTSIAAGIGCGLVSISRGPLVMDAVMIGGWVLFARLGVYRIIAAMVMAVVVVVAAAGAGFLPTVERLTSGLLERNEAAKVNEDFSKRAFGQTEEILVAASLAPFGNGLGFEQIGGTFFSSGDFEFATYEGQFPRVVMDTGVIGLIGYVFICLGALYALQLAKKNSSQSDRAFFLATQLLLASIFYASEVYNHTGSSFAWIIFVVVLARCNVTQAHQFPRAL